MRLIVTRLFADRCTESGTTPVAFVPRRIAGRGEMGHTRRHSIAVLATVWLCAVSSACGGGGSSSTPAPREPDFSLSVSPSSLTTAIGGTTRSVAVSVQSSNGFSGSVSVAITGLPAGTATTPAGPLTVSPGSSQSFTVLTTGSTPTGNATVTLTGTSGSS